MTVHGMFLARRLGVALMAIGLLAALAAATAGVSNLAALFLLVAGALTITPTVEGTNR